MCVDHFWSSPESLGEEEEESKSCVGEEEASKSCTGEKFSMVSV